MKARFIKTILLSALSAIGAFSAVTYSSCNPDKCKSIVCAYNGTCNNGTCSCATGYEGTRCETISREKYLGVWSVVEVGTITNIAHYTLSIKANDASSDVSQVSIYNFYNSLTSPVSASVKGDTLYIPSQTIDKKTISGFAALSTENTIYGQHAQMSVYYSVKDLTNGTTNDFGQVNGSASVWNK